MHVLYFHQHFSTPEGATGTRSYEFACHLISSGHEVTMVCGSYDVGNTGLTKPFKNGKRCGNVDGIEVIELYSPYNNSLSFISRTFSFLKFASRSILIALTHDYDLVFATSTPLTIAIPGIFAKYLKRKPFVFEVRDLWPELPREMGVITNPVILFLLSCLEWLSYRTADGCIGLSPGIVKGIVARSIERGSVVMIPNGCDFEIFSGSKEKRWRPDGVKSDDFMAIYAGTHGIANGLDAVIDAAVLMAKAGRDDVKIVFVGDGKLKNELVNRSKAENLDNCIFLDPVSKVRLAGLLKETDLTLMILANVPAFYYGTSPNKFFDYIAAGKPVLNNYPGWIADMLTEYKCGVVVAPGDANAFAEAVLGLVDNKDGLATMGNNAQLLAREKFDRNILANQFVKYLESKID
jgi:glycosyltransferase involved in cell wall biosynthesis